MKLIQLFLQAILVVAVVVLQLITSISAQNCTNQRQVCTDVTCGLDTHQPFFMNNTGCACTERDIGRRFTECDATTNTKALFEYYKAPAICISSAPLQEPVTGIPCGLKCGKGYKFDVASKSCLACQEGM